MTVYMPGSPKRDCHCLGKGRNYAGLTSASWVTDFTYILFYYSSTLLRLLFVFKSNNNQTTNKKQLNIKEV